MYGNKNLQGMRCCMYAKKEMNEVQVFAPRRRKVVGKSWWCLLVDGKRFGGRKCSSANGSVSAIHIFRSSPWLIEAHGALLTQGRNLIIRAFLKHVNVGFVSDFERDRVIIGLGRPCRSAQKRSQAASSLIFHFRTPCRNRAPNSKADIPRLWAARALRVPRFSLATPSRRVQYTLFASAGRSLKG